MIAPGDISLHREEFARVARKQLEERQTVERDRTRRKEREAEARDDDLAGDILVTVASAERIEQFTNRLDRYDSQLMDMLLENERMLVEVRKEREIMLQNAATLPDGRRVFRSEDGTRVEDEFGKDVTDEVDPNYIDPELPALELYEALDARDAAILAHNEQINALQTRLDEGRDRAASGEATDAELDEFEADFEASLAALTASQPALGDAPSAPAASAEFSLDDLAIPARVSAPPVPQ